MNRQETSFKKYGIGKYDSISFMNQMANNVAMKVKIKQYKRRNDKRIKIFTEDRKHHIKLSVKEIISEFNETTMGKYVDNSKDFDHKIKAFLKTIRSSIGYPVPQRLTKKVLLDFYECWSNC